MKKLFLSLIPAVSIVLVIISVIFVINVTADNARKKQTQHQKACVDTTVKLYNEKIPDELVLNLMCGVTREPSIEYIENKVILRCRCYNEK